VSPHAATATTLAATTAHHPTAVLVLLVALWGLPRLPLTRSGKGGQAA
jgi:hypothetical protein